MRRRELITLLGGSAAAWPLTAQAQKPERMRLVDVLMAYGESARVALITSKFSAGDRIHRPLGLTIPQTPLAIADLIE